MNPKSELIHIQNVAILSVCKPLLSIHLWFIQGGDHLIASALERIVTDVHPPLTLQ
jgi:hypothetical protein